MSKHIQLTIADPCHENWDNMTQAEKGRFCASCQKQVIDFTNMSDSQLAAFFKKPSEASVCGRFFGDQLDRSIEIPKKRIPWVKYFFQFALPAFLFSMKATAQGSIRMGKPAVAIPAKNTKKQKHKTDTIPSAPLLIAPVRISALERDSLSNVPVTRPTDIATCTGPRLTQFTMRVGGISVQRFSTVKRHSLKGKVLDEKGRRIPYASIKLENNSYPIYSDKNGKFYFPPRFNDSDSIILTASGSGYHEKEVVIYKKDRNDHVIIRLEPVREETVIEMVSIVPEETKSTPLVQQKITAPTFNLFKLSPNPVERNNVFHISFDSEKEEVMQLIILGSNGNLVLSQSQKMIKGYNRVSVTADTKWTAGIYIIQIRNEKGSVIKQEKLIVQ